MSSTCQIFYFLTHSHRLASSTRRRTRFHASLVSTGRYCSTFRSAQLSCRDFEDIYFRDEELLVGRTCKRNPIDALRQNIRLLLLQTFFPFEILKLGFISHLGISTFIDENYSTHPPQNVVMWHEVEYRAGLLSVCPFAASTAGVHSRQDSQTENAYLRGACHYGNHG